MFACPNCQTPLQRSQVEGGVLWACHNCGSLALSLRLLRRTIAPSALSQLWAAAGVSSERGRGCPVCRKPMALVKLPVRERQLPLDACTGCQFVWFDPTEYGALPTPGPTRNGSPEEWEILSRWEEQIRGGTAAESEAEGRWLDRRWKWIPIFFGLPVERDTMLLLWRPWLTWGLAATITAATLLAHIDLPAAVKSFGLAPAQLWRYGGVTFVTSFFLHAGLVHLVANLYFLLVFGDNVEDFLGRGRYLGLLGAAALAGDLLYILLAPGSAAVSIGASGGISGLITFYALQFPRARLLVSLIPPLPLRALFALGLWFGFQLVGAGLQLSGFGEVNFLAHLGGAGAGLVFWLLWRQA